jgi:8-oxo-dGTP pyrophosphatase MutT (NUDIX family)
LVQQKDGTLGLPAGLIEKGELLVESVLRELFEETTFSERANFTFKGRPQIVAIPEEDKTKLGVIFEVAYRGRLLSNDGWEVDDPGGDVVFARPSPLMELMDLIDHPERIYRPEFNFHLIMRYLVSKASTGSRGRIKYLDRWLERRYKKQAIVGLYPDNPPWAGYHGWCYRSPFDIRLPFPEEDE